MVSTMSHFILFHLKTSTNCQVTTASVAITFHTQTKTQKIFVQAYIWVTVKFQLGFSWDTTKLIYHLKQSWNRNPTWLVFIFTCCCWFACSSCCFSTFCCCCSSFCCCCCFLMDCCSCFLDFFTLASEAGWGWFVEAVSFPSVVRDTFAWNEREKGELWPKGRGWLREMERGVTIYILFAQKKRSAICAQRVRLPI